MDSADRRVDTALLVAVQYLQVAAQSVQRQLCRAIGTSQAFRHHLRAHMCEAIHVVVAQHFRWLVCCVLLAWA